MHSSNKKKKSVITPDEIIDWFDYWPDYDDCGPHCSCNSPSPTGHEEFYKTIAEIVADIIIKEQKLHPTSKHLLVEERMREYSYSSFWGSSKMNEEIKKDIAFIWPHIKGTKAGFELFSEIFGQND